MESRGVGDARRRRATTVLLVLLALLGGCTAMPLPPAARFDLAHIQSSDRPRVERNLAVFERVWRLVATRHYDPAVRGVDWPAEAAKFAPQAAAATDDRALYQVLNTMLEPLHDSHTHALRPEQADVRHTQQRARTGFRMVRVDGQWVVSEVRPDSPAARAGLKAGWIVLARNGEPLPERPDFPAQVGEELHWSVLDEQDRRVELTMRAEMLPLDAPRVVRELPDGIVYLRFDEFAGRERRWLSEQLKAHEAARGVIIDLRWNGGGDTFSLSTTIGEFFDREVDCGVFITRAGVRRTKSSWQLGSAKFGGRVVVLVDAATASAAEIFSAVLQEHGRAQLIGRKTAGAVLASRFHRLPDDGELQLSQMDYRAPRGQHLEGAGVTPDLVVERTLADVRTGRDRDLDAAQRWLAEQPPGGAARH